MTALERLEAAIEKVAKLQAMGKRLEILSAISNILDHAAKRATAKVEHGGKFDVVWSHERDALALADAILGDTQ